MLPYIFIVFTVLNHLQACLYQYIVLPRFQLSSVAKPQLEVYSWTSQEALQYAFAFIAIYNHWKYRLYSYLGINHQTKWFWNLSELSLLNVLRNMCFISSLLYL